MSVGKVMAVCISDRRGVEKRNVVRCRVVKDYGLVGDAHAEAGSDRQVSILLKESINRFESEYGINVSYGAFGENLVIDGFRLEDIFVGQKIKIGDEVLLEITQIGKKCHVGCVISKKTGKCIMPVEGVFARVIRGGEIKTGDAVRIIE